MPEKKAGIASLENKYSFILVEIYCLTKVIKHCILIKPVVRYVYYFWNNCKNNVTWHGDTLIMNMFIRQIIGRGTLLKTLYHKLRENLAVILINYGRAWGLCHIRLSFLIEGAKFIILQSWTKMLRHFTRLKLLKGIKSILFHPLFPIECCHCWYVVKTKLGELQTPRTNIEQEEGGLNIVCLAVSQHMRKKLCFSK